jgi:hypothetical protein
VSVHSSLERFAFEFHIVYRSEMFIRAILLCLIFARREDVSEISIVVIEIVIRVYVIIIIYYY